MEKPVRIIENDKIRNFNDKVRNGLEHAINFMLATDEASKIQISYFEPFLMPIETYIQAYKKKAVLIKIFAEKAYTGELYWFFELKTSIILGSLMRLMPLSAVEERIAKETFDATDQDAFGEVGNQLCGILDRAFRTLTQKNIHLRMDFNKKVYPDETININSFINKEEYVVLLCSVTVPKYGSQKLTLLIPRSLYEVLLNIEISLEGIIPKQVVLYSHDEDVLEKMQIELNSRYVKTIVATSVDDIFQKIDQPGICAAGFHFKEMKFPLSHQEGIYFKRLGLNRTLSRMPNFLTWAGADDLGLYELTKLGLKGSTKNSFMEHFPKWVHAFTQDPGKKY